MKIDSTLQNEFHLKTNTNYFSIGKQMKHEHHKMSLNVLKFQPVRKIFIQSKNLKKEKGVRPDLKK